MCKSFKREYKISDLFREPFFSCVCIGYILYLDCKLFCFYIGWNAFNCSNQQTSQPQFAKICGHKVRNRWEDLAKSWKSHSMAPESCNRLICKILCANVFNKQADHFLEMQRKLSAAKKPLALSRNHFCHHDSWYFVYLGQQIFNGTLNTGDIFGFITAVGLLSDERKNSIRICKDSKQL